MYAIYCTRTPGLPIYAQMSAIYCTSRSSYLRTDFCNTLYTHMSSYLRTDVCNILCMHSGFPIYPQTSAVYCTPRSSYLRTDGWNVIYCTHVSSYLRTFGRHMLYTRLPIYAHMSAICCTRHSFYNVHIVAIYCTHWHVLSSCLRWNGCNKLCSVTRLPSYAKTAATDCTPTSS